MPGEAELTSALKTKKPVSNFTKRSQCPGSPLKGIYESQWPHHWNKCRGAISVNSGAYKFAGDRVVGEFKNGKLNGHGTYLYANGDKYVGEWRDGKPNGQGTATFAKTGNKYVGEFRNKKYHGRGTFTWANGNKYVGGHRAGKRHGQGTFTFANGRIKEGIWKDNKLQSALSLCPGVYNRSTWTNCLGTITFSKTGNKYVGQFRNGIRNGQGTFTWPSGNKYVGEFRNGIRNGRGIFTWPNGTKYVGEYKNGKRNGQGTVTWPSGNKYVGQFRNGKRNGRGTFTWANGRIREGIWKNDKFQYVKKVRPATDHGDLPSCSNSPLKIGSLSEWPKNWDSCRGELIMELGAPKFAGDRLVGQFRNGKVNGRGTYFFANGDKYVGEYRNSKFSGHGTFFHRNGDKHVGGYRGGKRHGQGSYFYYNGDQYVGEYRNDQPNGWGTVTFSKTGSKYVGQFRNDKYHGRGTYIFGSASKWPGDKYVGKYRNGKRNGQGTYTFANGRKKEGVWKNGKFQYAQKANPRAITRRKPGSKPRRYLNPNKTVSAASGSGFSVSSIGHVVTNYHVIKGCQNVKIHHNGKAIPATVITHDPQNDLALLKGDFRPSTVLALSPDSPYRLQDVYVAGYPFGRRISTDVKITKGVISSLTGIANNFSRIQIDAALQPGNSGGPILDNKGNVVGVAVAKLDIKKILKSYGVIPENTNFGIKTSIVRTILESKNISTPSANRSSISKRKLGKMISDATYYLSCWMTAAQIQKMRRKKAIFQSVD
tara:strand:+ start:10576 stop:12867 length:2292 start_codon:yes stop_codon:yes gene_type:complete